MLFDPSIALRLCHDLLSLLRLHIARGLVRQGYPSVPNKWVRPTRRPADLTVGPTDLVGGPHNLLKTFRKIPDDLI
jgi:hypothetical protein